MYYGRKKGIIIAIVVAIVVVILLAVGGFFLYTSTDLFKSNKTLFWKYASNGMENVKTISNAQLVDIEKLI